MPELPEVETVRRAMERHLLGRQIRRVHTSGKRLRQPLSAERLKALAGARFVAAERRAKFLLLRLEGADSLLVHLGMTGNLFFRPAGQKHDHVVFDLDQGDPLVFSDPRRFGLVLVLNPDEEAACPYLTDLGPEPLDESFDAAYLHRCCRGRSRPIKNHIMDGRIVVGVGNIYASEALFRAGIRPTAPAATLGPARIKRLVDAIKETLAEAIRQGGTTISDYRGSGSGGRFQQRLAVYGRAGDACLACERPLESLVMAGRSTFYCPRCQRR